MLNVGHVLCAVDFSEGSTRALAHAAALARWYDAKLTALHVWSNIPAFEVIPALEGYTPPPPEIGDVARAAIEGELRALCARVAGDLPCVSIVREATSLDGEIVEQADARHADLLVIGSHGRSGFQHLLLGSIAEKVVRKAPCPVMVVPAHDSIPAADVRFKTIVCPVDFSDSSLAAVEFAFSLAEESDGRLMLVHVLETPPEFHALPTREGIDVDRIRAAAQADALTRLRALIPASVRSCCTVETSVADGKAHRVVLATAAAAHADLIVMGVSGHGALDRWVFGSNTANVMRAARCPVLIVRRPA